MKMAGKFTQIPDEWWKLVGKYPLVNKETGEILKDKKGNDRTVTISHWTVVLIAKIASFNYVKIGAEKDTFGKCTASNAYLADFLNVPLKTLKNALSDLYALGLLKSYEQREGNLTVKRFLYVNSELLHRLCQREDSPVQGTTQVTHTGPHSPADGTTKSCTGDTNKKEEVSIRKFNNIGREQSDECSLPKPRTASSSESDFSFSEEGFGENLDWDMWDDDEI